VIQHDVFGLDVPMNHLGDAVTVIQSLKHVYEVGLHVLADLVGQGAPRIPLRHQIDLVLILVVDHLVQPKDVRMLESFQNF
jgi:hypothetical protein